MQYAAVADAEDILATDAAEVRGYIRLAIYIDIVRAAVAPAVFVVIEAHPVNESDQSARSVGIEHQVVAAIRLAGRFAAPAGAKTLRLLHHLAGKARPVALHINARTVRTRFEFDARILRKRHWKITRITFPPFHRQENAVDIVILAPMHHTEKVADRRLHIR